MSVCDILVVCTSIENELSETRLFYNYYNYDCQIDVRTVQYSMDALGDPVPCMLAYPRTPVTHAQTTEMKLLHRDISEKNGSG